MDKPRSKRSGTVSNQGLGLFTDLYELTMAQAFHSQQMVAPATFSLFVRKYPPNRGYLVSAGLEDVLDYLEAFSFDDDSLEYLESTGIFNSRFLQYLANIRFTGSVRAIPEGRLFFTDEPVLEVTAPIIEAQLAETFIINQVNLQTLLATKAARCVWAAGDKPVSDFSARRAHGTDAAMKMARSSYLAGFQSTSNVLAASRYGIPPAGTMAHSFISSFVSEQDAFQVYADTFPDNTILLLDTYETLAGAEKAVRVARNLESRGHRLTAVRLDSGDFDSLSRQVRRILDTAGLEYVKILASGGLDEFHLQSLVHTDAPIDLFGVGTKAGVSADAPWSDMAYKLVWYDGRPVMKLSEDKIYRPGSKQVFRILGTDGMFARDILAMEDEGLVGGSPLLYEAMSNGTRTSPSPPLGAIRDQFNEDFQRLGHHFKCLTDPPSYPVDVTPNLKRLTDELKGTIGSH